MSEPLVLSARAGAVCTITLNRPKALNSFTSQMHEELAAVLALMPDEHRQVVGGREFWLGHLHGRPVVAVLSRIGKVAAATTATALIERFGVERIVFTGVAGGLAPGVEVGDVVVADCFLQHDLDASPIFPKYVLLLPGDAVRGALLVLAICALASVVAIRAALRVDPAAAIGG